MAKISERRRRKITASKTQGGGFIAFLDADDIALPGRLAEQVDFLQRNPGIAAVGSYVLLMDENGVPAGENQTPHCAPDEIAPTLLFENCMVQSSLMLRRPILPPGPFRTESEPAEDYDLWTRLIPAAQFAKIEYPLVQYRVHPGGVSARKAGRMKVSTRSIHAAQLARLGLDATAPEIDLHGRLSLWPLAPTKELVGQAGEWLLTLRQANVARGFYPQAAFDKVIARRWHSVCCDSWQLGFWAWKTFRGSPLRRLAPVTLAQQYAILRHAVPQTLRRFSS